MLLVFVAGTVAVTALCATAVRVDRANERELLRQRADEAATALRAVLPVFQVPLSSAAAVATETGADAEAFERVVGGFLAPDGLIQSASLWEVTDGIVRRLVVAGAPAQLATLPPQEQHAELVSGAGGLHLVDLTSLPVRTVGFAVSTEADGRSLIAYLESQLPEDPTALDLTGSAFDDLDYAVYLEQVEPEHLLLATTRSLPLDRSPATVEVPWGDGTLHLVFTPRTDLGGRTLALLPWLIAGVGGLLVVAFTWLTARLQRAIDTTAELAAENEVLYLEQRTVARTLQRDLLPPALPAHPAVELAECYQAGVTGIDVGGDWYDAIVVDDTHLLLTVGDVSGQGLPAATVMMSLRTAIRAYGVDGDGPAEILTKLNRLLDVRTDAHFATIVCASVDLTTGRVVLASAGHPPPVLASGGATTLVGVRPGFPIGVQAESTYEEVEVDLGIGDVLVAFTDGLYERRGELVDDGIARVQREVGELWALPLAEVVDRLASALEASAAPDDTAVLALRMRALAHQGADAGAVVSPSAPAPA